MTSQPTELEALTDVVRELSHKVDTLIHRLTIDRRTIRRLRLLSWFTVGVATVSIIGVVVTGVLYFQMQNTAKQNCENANEARRGNLVLWETILTANQKGRTPKQQVQAKEFATWVRALYAPHDCNNLNKKYDVPPPPNFN